MEPVVANRYQVLGQLGRGAMGAVYRVADTLADGEELALKIVTAAGEEAALRFKEEFRAMSKLRHPNTLAVFDFGRLDERHHFFTMELVPGRELTELIAEGPMPLERFYPLMIQLLRALGFIHARRYVHRDVKAANIRVTTDGHLKLMDFGLINPAGVAAGGQVQGTPGYLAPETVWGGTITPAVDLYAAGCLAFELLTGQVPFTGSVAEVLRAHRDQPPPRLRAHRPDASERLERVVSRLLEKDPARRYRRAEQVIVDLAALAGLDAAREAPEQRRSYLVSGVLVGRDAEMGALDARLAALKAGGGGAVLVGAPAGVGKSRLMKEFTLHASLADVPVVAGRGQASAPGPYEVVTAMLRYLLPQTPPDLVERLRPDLAGLHHSLFGDEVAASPTGEEAVDKGRLHDAILAWIRAVAGARPLVWFVDDMHLADPQTIEVFNYCARAGADVPALFVATLRSDETPAASAAWALVRESVAEFLSLGPLTAPQVEALVGEMLDAVRMSPGFSQALHAVTGDNPFYVEEVLRFLMEEGLLAFRDGAWHFPPDEFALRMVGSLEAAMERRVSNLTRDERDLARAAAVIGRRIELAALLDLAGLDEETFFARLDALVERQFLEKQGEVYVFHHDRLREALYRDMATGVRARLHQRHAAWLERRSRAQSMGWVYELAYHYARGLDRSHAFEYLSLAGDVSFQRGADAEALTYWRQAVDTLAAADLPDARAKAFELNMKIGRAGFILAPNEAVTALEEALPEIDAIHAGAPDRARAARVEALIMLGNAYAFMGAPRTGSEVVELALAACPPEAIFVRAAILTVQATNLMVAGRIDEMTDLARVAAAALMREEFGDVPGYVYGARVGVAAFRNAVCFQGVRPDERLSAYAYWASAEIGDESPITIRQFFGIWYAWTGRYEEAMGYIEESQRVCKRIGAPPYHWTFYLRAQLLFDRGAYDEALAVIDLALQYPHLDQLELTRLLIAVLQGQVLAKLERVSAGRMALNGVLTRAEAHGMGVVVLRALVALGELELDVGDATAARAPLQEAYDRAAEGPLRNPLHQAIAGRLLGEALRRQGDRSGAFTRLTEALAIATRPEQDNRVEQAHGLRALGAWYLEAGRTTEALNQLRRAGDLYHGFRNLARLHEVIRLIEDAGQRQLPAESKDMAVEARWQLMSGMLG